jgi:hypothetical protein
MSGTTLTGTDGLETGGAEPNEQQGTDAATEPEIQQLSLDVIFELLRVSRRREVLWYLQDNEGTARLDELAEYIAAKENDIEIHELTSSQRKRVYIGLYQCHLPKMDDSDVIDYDQARGTIELRQTAQQLYPYLALDPLDPPSGDSGTLQRMLSKLRS